MGGEDDGDDLGSRHSGVSALSNHSFCGATPMSQRSAGSLARQAAYEAKESENALLRAALEASQTAVAATQSAGESAREVAELKERDRQ